MAEIKHESAFVNYLNKKQGLDTVDDGSEENDFLFSGLSSLAGDAMNILKEEVHSDDPHRRLKAAIAIMELNVKAKLGIAL